MRQSLLRGDAGAWLMTALIIAAIHWYDSRSICLGLFLLCCWFSGTCDRKAKEQRREVR